MTLLDHLIREFPTAKKTTFRRMIEDGRVRINGMAARTLKQPLRETDIVKVQNAQAPRETKAKLSFPIVFEDADLLVIDKPPGLLTSTVPNEKRPTALAKITKYLSINEPGAQVGLIHRLDRDASGLLVFSKNDSAYRSLKDQFFNHTVDRIYSCIVDGVPSPRQGTIDMLLVEHVDGTVHIARDKRRGQRAVTHYETVESKKGKSLLRVRLETGKKHQIRVHLSHKTLPIINDPVYHSKPGKGRLMLAAVELGFNHPRSKERLKFTIPAPTEFQIG